MSSKLAQRKRDDDADESLGRQERERLSQGVKVGREPQSRKKQRLLQHAASHAWPLSSCLIRTQPRPGCCSDYKIRTAVRPPHFEQACLRLPAPWPSSRPSTHICCRDQRICLLACLTQHDGLQCAKAACLSAPFGERMPPSAVGCYVLSSVIPRQEPHHHGLIQPRPRRAQKSSASDPPKSPPSPLSHRPSRYQQAVWTLSRRQEMIDPAYPPPSIGLHASRKPPATFSRHLRQSCRG